MPVDGEGDKPTFSADDLSHISAPAEGDAGKAGGEAGAKPADDGKGAGGDAAPGGEKAPDGKTGGKPASADGVDGKPDAGAAGGDADGKGEGEKPGGEKGEGEPGKDAGKESGKEPAAETAWPKDGFPDDWRDRLIGSLKLEGDALKKAQETAKRASSPADLLRSVMAAAGKIQEANDQVKGRPPIPTGKDDKPEDVAAFDKAWGVPESPDKYALPERPKDLGERTEEDIALLKPALERFHKGHFSQAQVNEMIRVMDETELTLARARAANAKAFDEQSEDSLRLEWGTPADYKANMQLANDAVAMLLGKHLPEQADRQALLSLTLDNGRKLGSYPPLVKLFADLGRQLNDDGAFPEGAEAGGKDPAARMAEIARLMHTGKPEDEAEYKRLEPEMRKLAAIVERRAQKQ